MRLVVKNVGTDVDPKLRVFTETGEQIVNVTAIGITSETHDLTRATMSWLFRPEPPTNTPKA